MARWSRKTTSHSPEEQEELQFKKKEIGNRQHSPSWTDRNMGGKGQSFPAKISAEKAERLGL